MQSQLSESFRGEFEILKEVGNAGFVRFHPKFPGDYVSEHIECATDRVRILANWVPNPIQLEHSIAAAARRQVEVQLMLLNPESPSANNRARDLRYSDLDTVRHQIQNSLSELGRFLQTEGLIDKVEIRLHDSLPTHLLFEWDNTVLFGILFVELHALQGHFFEFEIRESGIGHRLSANFENMWRHAKPYSLSNPRVNKSTA